MAESKLTTDKGATFKLNKALFRLKFQDESGQAISVYMLDLLSSTKDIITLQQPFDSYTDYGDDRAVAAFGDPLDDYVYFGLLINEAATPGTLSFFVRDADGKEYKG